MNVQSINNITTIDLPTIHKILSSTSISERQKENFVRQHASQISQVFQAHISLAEYKFIMRNRPLRKFRFLKNAITKRGDKIFLAETLGVDPAELDDYIGDVEDAITDFDKLSFLPKDKLDAIKTYIYRHGSKDEIVSFLDYELKTAKDVIKTLYRTLKYHTGGVADYFIRPVHKMSNNTMIQLYNVIDKNMQSAIEKGSITKEEYDETARWALVRIYDIQNNSKLINAIKTYKVLNG